MQRGRRGNVPLANKTPRRLHLVLRRRPDDAAIFATNRRRRVVLRNGRPGLLAPAVFGPETSGRSRAFNGGEEARRLVMAAYGLGSDARSAAANEG